MTDPATLFMLLTITYGGQVSYSGHMPEQACLEARSLVLTGLTRAQKRDFDRLENEQRRQDDAAFEAANPPRKPTAKELTETREGATVFGANTLSPKVGVIGKDGLIHFSRENFAVATYIDPAKAKTAECVLEKPE